ncbi:MAG: 6-bladed beta-propeller [Gammaproteobacteria bacterium]|nr:6-bladed beta-propeller [Gammaproteobacteria bacterium]
MYRFRCLLAVLLLGGCASAPPTLKLVGQVEQPVEWPSPPEQARFRYLGELTGEDNIFVDPDSRQIGKRIFDWLVGLAAGPRRPVILQRPQSGYTDADGRTYVTDVSRGAIYAFDEPAGALHVWDMADQNTRFITPVAIGPGPDHDFFVSDADLGYVVHLNAQGTPVGHFGGDELKRPTGLAYDPKTAKLFVADTAEHDIKVFDAAGHLVRRIGHLGEGDGEFNGPTYLTLVDGALYVTDTLNARVQVLDEAGRFIRKFGRRGLFLGDTPRPKGVAVDDRGHAYVVESYYDYLLVFDDSGRFLLPIGGTGSGVGQFYLPAGVWVDGHHRVYVADSFNGRVVVMKYLDGDH